MTHRALANIATHIGGVNLDLLRELFAAGQGFFASHCFELGPFRLATDRLGLLDAPDDGTGAFLDLFQWHVTEFGDVPPAGGEGLLGQG